jgi:hypothetical protein
MTIAYTFGTYEENADGKTFREIESLECGSDAQAELNARQILDDSSAYDLTDMDGNQIAGLYIQRGYCVEWFMSA